MNNTLKEKISADLKKALKSDDKLRTSTLRLLIAAITNKEIELRKKDTGLSDEEVIAVIRSEAKKRKDAIQEFKKGEREDLAQKEEDEFKILESYLPEEISDEELLRVVEMSIREVGAQNSSDFGNVMKAAMGVLKGKASGDRVSEVVKKKLSKE